MEKQQSAQPGKYNFAVQAEFEQFLENMWSIGSETLINYQDKSDNRPFHTFAEFCEHEMQWWEHEYGEKRDPVYGVYWELDDDSTQEIISTYSIELAEQAWIDTVQDIWSDTPWMDNPAIPAKAVAITSTCNSEVTDHVQFRQIRSDYRIGDAQLYESM